MNIVPVIEEVEQPRCVLKLFLKDSGNFSFRAPVWGFRFCLG